MNRLLRWVFPLAVLFGTNLHAQELAPALQIGLRPAGYQLALSKYSQSGNTLGVEVVYRVTDPADRFEWLLGAEADLSETLSCPGGNGGYCGEDAQLWLTTQQAAHRIGHWSTFSTIQLGGGLMWPGQVSFKMIGAKFGLGADYWVTPKLAIELLPSYIVGLTLGLKSTEKYQNLALQLGIRIGI